jgi:signal transduction histidine kinase
MKIFKSIKWRLQLWYGLILVLVLGGFGSTTYQLEHGKMYRQIDKEVMRRVGILSNALRPPPPRGPDAGEPPFDRPPPGQIPGDGLPRQDSSAPAEFHLPPQAAGLFDPGDPNGFYFIIKLRDGSELARSTNAPVEKTFWGSRTSAKNGNTVLRVSADPFHSPTVFTFGKIREFVVTLPSGEAVLVGCSIAPALKEFWLLILKLVVFGGVILSLGLAGGWWMVGRAIRPIDDISAAAVKISAGDLSQRINVAEAESELGQLAAVLNSTFARLEAAFAQQRQFTSDAAHELRTPVSVMLTQTQTALNRERSAAEYRETLEACQRAAQRMRRLTESLLELARLDAGQEQMKRMKFDLSQIARNCVELIRPLADERSIKILCELSPLECVGDSERIAQVITNLLTNAIQYNQAGGEVRLVAQSQNGMATLAVSNTGRGITAEDLPHLFEKFYRADQSRTSGNTGLGLAISRAIVEAHGGTIEVASQPDAGTTFTIRLPAV